MHKNSVTAVIMAGGKARRMGGVDKGLIKLHQQPLVKRVLDKMQGQVSGCMINANRNIEDYAELGVPVVKDLSGDFEGPLMAMATGLYHAPTEWVLLVPCDTPKLPEDLVERLKKGIESSGLKIAVACDGKRLQSAVILLNKSLLPSLKEQLRLGLRKVETWYKQHQFVSVDFSDKASSFINVNSWDDLSEIEKQPPMLGICAWSGTGKTTLLTQLIPKLREEGIRVGVIKHAHHKFDIDKPGKDSYKLRKAGANQMLIGSSHRWALMVEQDPEQEPRLDYLFNQLDHSELDLVLVEGFKHEVLPKIELYRPSLGKEHMYLHDENFIAIATDAPITLKRDITHLNLNDINEISAYLKEFLQKVG